MRVGILLLLIFFLVPAESHITEHVVPLMVAKKAIKRAMKPGPAFAASAEEVRLPHNLVPRMAVEISRHEVRALDAVAELAAEPVARSLASAEPVTETRLDFFFAYGFNF